MNKELFDKLNELNDLALSIDAKTKSITERLDELIKALHDYDDDQLHCEYSGLPSVKAYDEPLQGPCSKHDAEQWNEERMNIIGQNGNEGTHYTDVDENEFNDYGERVNNNTQTKRVSKPLVEGENKSGSKGDTGDTQAPPPPKPPKPKRRYYKPKNKK
jgi:hypothetical protein